MPTTKTRTAGSRLTESVSSPQAVADRKATSLPYSVRKTDEGYQVVDRETGKVYSRHTTRDKAESQRRLLEGIRHGWKPTGKKGDG
jgi:phage gp16-like protein